jgi:hypothetical protein
VYKIFTLITQNYHELVTCMRVCFCVYSEIQPGLTQPFLELHLIFHPTTSFSENGMSITEYNIRYPGYGIALADVHRWSRSWTS